MFLFFKSAIFFLRFLIISLVFSILSGNFLKFVTLGYIMHPVSYSLHIFRYVEYTEKR